MHQIKILSIVLLVCYSMVQCQGAPVGASLADLNCGQYANDLEIIFKFPFKINIDAQKQGEGISTAFLDSSDFSVTMLQLRQAGATVPNSVFCLKKLRSLDIMNMNFVDGVVPDALSNLQLLFGFTITKSPITKMTKEIASLPNLEMLTLDDCSLTEMPSLYGLSKLFTLSLPNNRLSKLEGLMNLYRLFLYKNLFTEVPTQTNPEKLRMLDMNHNPVQNMPDCTVYGNLTDIRLSNTQVSTIPSNIDELESLSFLDLSFSKITEVPDAIFKLPDLDYLVIQGNSFSSEKVNAIKAEFQAQRPDIHLLI